MASVGLKSRDKTDASNRMSRSSSLRHSTFAILLLPRDAPGHHVSRSEAEQRLSSGMRGLPICYASLCTAVSHRFSGRRC
jgi:hypothetical protein